MSGNNEERGMYHSGCLREDGRRGQLTGPVDIPLQRNLPLHRSFEGDGDRDSTDQ